MSEMLSAIPSRSARRISDLFTFPRYAAMSNPAMHDLSQLARPVPLRVLVPLIVACALFMENLDATVLSTALPAIANDLHQSPIQLKLALTSYLLTLAVFLPASGWFADRFGTRVVFRLAILIFALGSALCGFAGFF